MELKVSAANDTRGDSLIIDPHGDRVLPVIIAGKIYVRGADGFRVARAAGIAGMAGSLHQPSGYYVRMPSGVRLHDKDGAPFVFIKRERDSGFIVTCHETPSGIRYMFGASESDLRKLGLDPSVRGADRLERELAECILWETSPEAGETVYELHQRMQAAEAEYERALDRVYGVKREPETRYWPHTEASLKAASQTFDAASHAWRAADRFRQTPAMVHEALVSGSQHASMEVTPLNLVVRWEATDTASFATNGPRDELVMVLGRLVDDLDARERGSSTYDPVPLLDTNGNRVGLATFEPSLPGTPENGKPLLIVPEKNLAHTSLVVTDVYTKLQSSIEDVHLVSHVDDTPTAYFYWRDLPVLERQWHNAAGTTRESLQSTHDRVRQQLVVQDQTNPNACFITTYEGMERIAESLNLQACLQGFGDSARVGYFKDGQWTGIASEITLNGKVLTTVNGQRAEGTGYTADGEWQRDQLESALTRLPHAFDAMPLDEVYAQAADLYEPSTP